VPVCFPSPSLGLGAVAAVNSSLPPRRRSGVVDRLLSSQERLSGVLQHQHEVLGQKADDNVQLQHTVSLAVRIESSLLSSSSSSLLSLSSMLSVSSLTWLSSSLQLSSLLSLPLFSTVRAPLYRQRARSQHCILLSITVLHTCISASLTGHASISLNRHIATISPNDKHSDNKHTL